MDYSKMKSCIDDLFVDLLSYVHFSAGFGLYSETHPVVCGGSFVIPDAPWLNLRILSPNQAGEQRIDKAKAL